MPRRRWFRPKRLLGPLPHRGQAAGPARELARAHRLMEVGQHANAAAIFERLGRESLDHGYERQAPFMFLQAGRAHLLAGHTQEASEWLREGLAWLVRQERWLTLRRATRRVVEDLARLGYTGIGEDLSGWIAEAFEERNPAADRPEAPAVTGLPFQCPHCSAPLRPDEVERLDDLTVECSFCGGMIQTNPER